MKINVTLSIEVSPEAWLATGANVESEDAAGVRQDVKDYLLNLAQCSALVEESGAEVTLK